MKTTAEKFQRDVEKVIAAYLDDATKDLDDLTKEIGKKGAKAVRSSSASEFGAGRYSKGWTSTLEKTRLGATAIIYNKTPGLPHLLENGHATRNGGRVKGREHIAPVEEQIVEEFTKAVTDAF